MLGPSSLAVPRSDDVGLNGVVDRIRRIAACHTSLEEGSVAAITAVAACSQNDGALQILGTVAERACSVPFDGERAGLRIAGLERKMVPGGTLEHSRHVGHPGH